MSEFAHLIELQFSSGTTRLATSAQQLVTDPYAVRIGAVTTRYLLRNPVTSSWPTTNLTVEAWARRDVGDTEAIRAIFSYAQTAASPDEFNEILLSLNASTGALTLYINGATVSTASGAVPDDALYHDVIATWKSSGGAVVIYVDGVQKLSTTGLKSGYSIVGGGAVVLGQEQDSLGGSFAATQAWKGELDDVRLYARVLTAAEVSEHFARKFSNETQLVGRWPFDVRADLGRDFSPGGNHLTVTGITDPETDTSLRREWEAVGGLLEFGGIEETGDAKGQGVDLRLSGVDQTIVAALLNNKYLGRSVRIWRAMLDTAAGTVIPDPILLFQGLQLGTYEIEEERTREAGTVRIRTRAVGHLGLERLRGIQANLVSHQHHFSGDTFFNQVAQLANRKIHWATQTPEDIARRVIRRWRGR